MILAAAALLLYVTNERAGTVSVIDAKTDAVVNTFSVGTRPRGIVASGKRLYIAVSHFRDKPTRDRDGVVAVDSGMCHLGSSGPDNQERHCEFALVHQHLAGVRGQRTQLRSQRH